MYVFLVGLICFILGWVVGRIHLAASLWIAVKRGSDGLPDRSHSAGTIAPTRADAASLS